MIKPNELGTFERVKATRNLDNSAGQTVVYKNYIYEVAEVKSCGTSYCPSKHSCSQLYIRLKLKPINNIWWCCVDFIAYPHLRKSRKPTRMELLIL